VLRVKRRRFVVSLARALVLVGTAFVASLPGARGFLVVEIRGFLVGFAGGLVVCRIATLARRPAQLMRPVAGALSVRESSLVVAWLIVRILIEAAQLAEL